MQLNAYSKDRQGAYVAANVEFLAFTHLNHIDELLGKTDQDLPWACNATHIMGNDARVIATGLRRKNFGRSRHVRACGIQQLAQ